MQSFLLSLILLLGILLNPYHSQLNIQTPSANLIGNQSFNATSIAIEFLNSKFGHKEYKLLNESLEGSNYKLRFFDGDYLYILQVNAQLKEVIDYLAKKIDMSFKLEEKANFYNLSCLKNVGGFEVNFNKSKPYFDMYYVLNREVVSFSTHLEFVKILEFVDNGNDKGVLDPMDEIVKSVNLMELNWSLKINYLKLDNKVIEIFFIYRANYNNSEIEIKYNIAPSSFEISYRDARNSYSVGISISISSFKWERPNSMLALALEYEPEGYWLSRNDGSYLMVNSSYEIKNLANLDNSDLEVKEIGSQDLTYIIYPHFTHSMIHELNAGYIFKYLPLILNNPILILIILLVLSTISLILIIKANKRRKEIELTLKSA